MPGTPLDREGIFRARPMSWSVRQSPKDDSRATSINVRYEILDQFDPDNDAWGPAWPAGYEVFGSHWVIKKDGSPNGKAVGDLVRSLGWSGKFEDVGRDPSVLGLKDCRIEVERDEYDGEVRYRVSWLNPIDWVPQAGGLSAAELKTLDTTQGAAMRALVGTIREHDDIDPTAKVMHPDTKAAMEAEQADASAINELPY